VINILLWFLGFVALGVAILNIRVPLARMQEIDRLADNAKRYESWRGGSRTAAGGGSETTGADILRQMLRRQVLIWAALAVVGVVLILAGFAIR
jgi:hypothetical protein